MKTNYILPLFLFVFLSTFQVNSQNIITGSLVDQHNDPVAFANVILLKASDSTTVYRGTVSNENGEFILENIESDAYLFTASYIGFLQVEKRIEVEGDTALGTFVMDEDIDSLGEVTVNGKRPTVVRSIDRITFNVENTVLSGGNTFELLKRTPGVIVSQGELLVRNRPAVVYINDRRVYLTREELQQLLEGFSGANVRSVEVITNPPAKYDAEGGAILNIQTSKNISIGYKGSVNAAYTEAILPKYLVGTSQYYKNDWMNVFASYNLNYRDDFKRDETRIEYFRPGGGVDSRWFENFERETHTQSHNLNTIIDFTLSERSSLSLSANVQLTPRADSDITGRTEIYNPQNSLDSLFTTGSTLDNRQDNILLNATYDTQLGDNGATLSIGGNLISYDDRRLQHLNTEYFLPTGELLNTNNFSTNSFQKSNIYTAKIDVASPLGSVSMETGLKYSGIRSNSAMDFFFYENNIATYFGDLSDEFDYNEDIYAGYLSLARDWDTWSIKGGVRGEYTDVNAISVALGDVNTQNYFELFPTFYLIHTPGDDHSFGVDYSRRIIRPRFQSLNPFRYFINENNFNMGNPYLRPSISNKINFNYTYKNKLSFDAYWDRADDSPALLPFQDNVNRVLRTVEANMDFEQQFSLDISFYDYVKDWWYLYIYSSVFYMQADFFALESGNQVVTNDVISTFVQAQNFFTLSQDRTFTGELGFYYLPDYVTGSYRYDQNQMGVSLGLRKTFFDNRLSASVNVEDLFNTMNIPLTSQYLNQNNTFYGRPESRMVRFAVTYNFGNFKLRDNQRGVSAEEGERLKEATRL